LDEAAAIEHFVTKWGRLLRWISSVIWRIFVEHSFDIGAKSGEFFSHEDAIEYYITL